MCESDDRDDWLEGVRRWYFGGTPGPDDEVAACAEVEAPSAASTWQGDAALSRAGRLA